MTPLPVVATVREAYAFAWQHLGAVIGLIWVPMLVLTISGFFAKQRFYNDLIEALSSGNGANLGPSMLMMLGYVVAALLFYAMMIAAVTQLALGQRSGPVVAHFAFGAPEWRTFRALAGLLGLALLILMTAVMAVSALLAMAGGGKTGPQDGMALVLVLYGLIIAGAPRFLLLLPAVAVAESEPALRRTWSLSAGHFWRLLAVLVLTFVPPLTLLVVVETLLAGPMAALDASGDKMLIVSSVMRARQVLPLSSGLGFLVAPLLVALFSGASVSVWRAIKEKAPALTE